MTITNSYILDLLKQIKTSYQTLTQLKDKSGDLEIIKKETSKIFGLVKVLENKLETNENNSDDYVSIYKFSVYYLENYDFLKEIETMSQLYSQDSARLKNIRLSILSSLEDKRFLEKIDIMIEKSG